MDEERFLTTQEVASILKVHRRSVIRFIRDGDLEAVRVGGQWRITREALERYIEKRRKPAR